MANCTLGLVLLNAELVIGVVGCDEEVVNVPGVRLPSDETLDGVLIGGAPMSESGAFEAGGSNGGPKWA